jgi:hypothetical protein
VRLRSGQLLLMRVPSKESQVCASWDSSEAVALAEGVRLASEAVTMLADRLNALALRVALIGGVPELFETHTKVEAYLYRLSSLVNSAGEQMSRIQKLLHALEAGTLQADSKRSETRS